MAQTLSPAIVSPKSWLARCRRRRCFTVLALAPESALRTAIPEHVEREIAIALLAAFIFAGLQPFFDLVGLIGDLCNQIVGLSATKHRCRLPRRDERRACIQCCRQCDWSYQFWSRFHHIYCDGLRRLECCASYVSKLGPDASRLVPLLRNTRPKGVPTRRSSRSTGSRSNSRAT